MTHLLVIDDDDRIRELLEQYLEKNNFIVFTANNTKEARKLMNKYIFDLMVVDNMMPEENGIKFLTDIRSKNNLTPAIMLTALGEIENRIEGLSAGADDYLSKPFEPKELILRINNILKRTIKEDNSNNIISFNNLKFYIDKNELYDENNNLVKLTDAENKILNIFIKNKNIVLTRERLRELCNGIDERSIDVQITRLRKKIENDPKNPKFLKTIRYKGYLLSI